MLDKDLAMQDGAKNRENIEINGFILHLFKNNNLLVEQILKREIEENMIITDKDIETYYKNKKIRSKT